MICIYRVKRGNLTINQIPKGKTERKVSMENTQQIPVGALMRPDGTLRTPIIRDFKQRSEWQKKQGDKKSVLAFYNSGTHLFMDPMRNPATTWYHYKWHWVSFERFKEPRYILVNNEMIAAGLSPNLVSLVHRGHRLDDSNVELLMGVGNYRIGEKSDFQTRLFIPPRCILYVSVRYYRVWDKLLVSNPLPGEYVKLPATELEFHPWTCDFVPTIIPYIPKQRS
jgi:hypothetical protein